MSSMPPTTEPPRAPGAGRCGAPHALLMVATWLAAAGCGSDGGPPEPDGGGADAAPETDAGDVDGADAAPETDASDAPDVAPGLDTIEQDGSGESAPQHCGTAAPMAFDAIGPYGARRHDRAADFSVPRTDGSTWTLSEAWSGCDSVVIMPDGIAVSPRQAVSIWTQGVAGLVEASPPNVLYVFVSTRGSASAAAVAIDELEARIDEALVDLPLDQAQWWAERLIVSAVRAEELESWIGSALTTGIGQLGLAIDRFQRVRAVGSLADVDRYDAQLAAQDEWPWENSLAYAANEPRYYNYEADRQARLDVVDATEVHFWQGEVIERYADMEVDLPSAEEMAQFDTLELDVTQRCPNPNAIEAGNCGAWDYLAHLWLFVGEDERVELARHITSYHREGRWVIDITPMLARLRDGGRRKFRWEWAPEWNTQPTATFLTLRFSNQAKGARPATVTELFSGGPFNEQYNDGRQLARVPIATSAARVELWAIITGHGASTEQCAEFCNHQHEFIVNGRSFYREHPMVGDQHGCMAQIEDGAVPNQWGTWWFGRGGWCPGMQVNPFVVDVTDLVTPGSDVTVDYYGWLGGRTPPANAGDVLVTSFLVTYE